MTFQSFTDLETPLAEAPLFFVEAKDSGPASELERQVSFRQQCRIHLPHVMLTAIPNASKRGHPDCGEGPHGTARQVRRDTRSHEPHE